MIPMKLSFNELQYVIGSLEIVEAMNELHPLNPFANEIIAFLNDLSGILIKEKKYPDVATFGFWCRKAAILKVKENYDDLDERFGKGIAFHSTPSNVPVNFAFSFAAGILAGNANIVRLPGKSFEQVDIICNAISYLLDVKYESLSPYIVFVKYPSIKEITDAFSSICNVRVIWGGDRTIAEIRKSEIPPRTTEITFTDRHSIAVIDSDEYIKADNKDVIIQNFYNDTYYTDQNACTSPRIIFWKGIDPQTKEDAKNDFWVRVHKLVKSKYSLAPVQSVGKLNAFYLVAARKNVQLIKSDDMLVTRVKVENVNKDLMDYKYNSGFFFEKDIKNLSEIIDVCDIRCQTLTYYGIDKDEFRVFFDTCRPFGIDRLVPMGKSMDFSLVWDGYDLIRQMSRKITIV